MKLSLYDYIYLTYYEKNSMYHTRERIVCIDGFSMSVQGNVGSYSSPRTYTNKYECMEIGFTSVHEELLGEEEEDVYGYVEFDIIEKIVEKHGGINVEETTRNCKEPKLRNLLNRKKKLESL
ncbi:hypothetical protein M0Q50_01930 [bacterium]|jgi:hypothetical protein|nr:hypothetical protein [bacterium]